MNFKQDAAAHSDDDQPSENFALVPANSNQEDIEKCDQVVAAYPFDTPRKAALREILLGGNKPAYYTLFFTFLGVVVWTTTYFSFMRHNKAEKDS